MRLCRPHSSIADAITSPLRKRKLVSKKYWGQTFLEGRMPMVGKRHMGSIAVTASGRASVHQNIAIRSTTYRHFPSCKRLKKQGMDYVRIGSMDKRAEWINGWSLDGIMDRWMDRHNIGLVDEWNNARIFETICWYWNDIHIQTDHNLDLKKKDDISVSRLR